MAKKKSSGNALLYGMAIVIAILVAIPKGFWIGLGVLIAIFFVARLLLKKSETDVRQASLGVTIKSTPPRSAGGSRSSIRTEPCPTTLTPLSPLQSVSRSSSRNESFTTAVIGNGNHEYGIPQPRKSPMAQAHWISPEDTIEIAGLSISGGMIYVGSGLRGGFGQIEPALINPSLKVSQRNVDLNLRLTDYWPTYSECTPDARRAYLQWLASGRRALEANVGYVFLFFYGLERRVLVDAPADLAAKADIPKIIQEVKRLLTNYSEHSSFRRYASQFLGYIEAESVEPMSYKQTPPQDKSFELPLRLRIGLGQLAVDQQPVPASWAHAWALADPNIVRRTAVGRCSEIFETLFIGKYADTYGDGLRLPINRTKLKIAYQPASAALSGRNFTRNIGDLPDVSALSAPVKKLQDLVNICTDLLDPFSRFIGRNPDKKDALEGVLLLPAAYWPNSLRTELNDIKAQVRDGMLVMSFGELTGRLKSAGTLSRDKILGLARALESLQLGMEPDVLSGHKLPKIEDSVALFIADPDESAVRSTPAYQAASVTLDLACSVALADGNASGPELIHLTRQIESWTHLSSAHRKRLKAHLRLSIKQPTTLTGLKKKLEPLSLEAKRTIAKFLAHLAEADGTVSPDEVKFLERVYKTLRLDAKLVYSDLHSAGTPIKGVAFSEAQKLPSAATFVLDPERIAQLQKETEDVTVLLASVFADEVVAPETAPAEEEVSPHQPSIMGLDQSYIAFLRMLISRPTWTRQELADVAADMELMLDGALEHINEASLDNFDATLVDGDDLIEVNQEVVEKLPA